MKDPCRALCVWGYIANSVFYYTEILQIFEPDFGAAVDYLKEIDLFRRFVSSKSGKMEIICYIKNKGKYWKIPNSAIIYSAAIFLRYGLFFFYKEILFDFVTCTELISLVKLKLVRRKNTSMQWNKTSISDILINTSKLHIFHQLRLMTERTCHNTYHLGELRLPSMNTLFHRPHCWLHCRSFEVSGLLNSFHSCNEILESIK